MPDEIALTAIRKRIELIERRLESLEAVMKQLRAEVRDPDFFAAARRINALNTPSDDA